MTINLPGWLGIIVAILTIVAAAATAFAVFMSTYFKSRNDLKDRMIEDFKGRNTQLEADLLRKEAELLVKTNAITALEKIVVGHDELVKIQQLMVEHDKSVIQGLESVRAEIREVVKA